MADVFPVGGAGGAGGAAHGASSSTEVEVAELIGSLSRRLRRAAHHELGPLGVTPAQLRALRTVDGCGAAIRMSELADRLHIARRSATSVVEELVDRGLLERQADPDDRRAVEVAVTAAGRRLLRRVQERRRSAARRLLTRLSPQELAELGDLLRRLEG